MPTTQPHSQNGTQALQTENEQTGRTASPESAPASRSTPDSRRNERAKSKSRSNERAGRERLDRTLSQKKGPDTVMLGVLSAALVLGVLGLALHFLWVVAIIVMALGLGFTIANARRDRIDVTNHRADHRAVDASQQPAPRR
jgi:Flp pilus assembly protein TadB